MKLAMSEGHGDITRRHELETRSSLLGIRLSRIRSVISQTTLSRRGNSSLTF